MRLIYYYINKVVFVGLAVLGRLVLEADLALLLIFLDEDP